MLVRVANLEDRFDGEKEVKTLNLKQFAKDLFIEANLYFGDDSIAIDEADIQV